MHIMSLTENMEHRSSMKSSFRIPTRCSAPNMPLKRIHMKTTRTVAWLSEILISVLPVFWKFLANCFWQPGLLMPEGNSLAIISNIKRAHSANMIKRCSSK